jgi:hypothetical protein
VTVEEAVRLVAQADALGRDGEVPVLDIGQPVKIADVAQRLAAQADDPPQIEFTGLRPGENSTKCCSPNRRRALGLAAGGSRVRCSAAAPANGGQPVPAPGV